MSDLIRKCDGPEPRLVAVFVAAVTACALWAEQPSSRAHEGGEWHRASGWPFVSTFYPGTTSARHLPLGEVANVLALVVIAVCVYHTTLQVGRWVANCGRVSVKGMMITLTTAAVGSAALVGRFDGFMQAFFRSLGLVPTEIEDSNFYLTCAWVSMVHMTCVLVLIGMPVLVRFLRELRVGADGVDIPHDTAATAD